MRLSARSVVVQTSTVSPAGTGSGVHATGSGPETPGSVAVGANAEAGAPRGVVASATERASAIRGGVRSIITVVAFAEVGAAPVAPAAFVAVQRMAVTPSP